MPVLDRLSLPHYSEINSGEPQSSFSATPARVRAHRMGSAIFVHTGEGGAMADRLLLRGGYVVTMDEQLGDIPGGDVLVEGDTIVQVGRDLAAADAEVIDAQGKVVIPGFIDTHRHTWETAIRGCAPDATLDDYFVEVLDTFAPLYRPDDVFASNLAGALECLNAGITTLVDWSHINNTPEHPDAAIQALKDAGIRAVYAYGSANTSLQAYWFNSTIVMPREAGRCLPSPWCERVQQHHCHAARGCRARARAVLQLGSRAAHDGPRNPRPRLLHR